MTFVEVSSKLTSGKAYDLHQTRFLSQELLSGIPRIRSRRVELFVETTMKGEKSAVYIHLETQAYQEKDFEERMFLYFCKLYAKYRSQILPIAIFSHNGKTEKDTYSISFRFTEVMNFKFQKLELISTDWRAYIKHNNPVTAALLSVMGYKPIE